MKSQFSTKKLLLFTTLISVLCAGLLFLNNSAKTEIVIGLYDANQNQIIETNRISIRVPGSKCMGTSWDQLNFLLADSVIWPHLKHQTVARENDRLGEDRYFAFRLNENLTDRAYELIQISESTYPDTEFRVIFSPGDRIDIYGSFERDDGTISTTRIADQGCVLYSPRCSIVDQSLKYVIGITPNEAEKLAAQSENARSVRLSVNYLD